MKQPTHPSCVPMSTAIHVHVHSDVYTYTGTPAEAWIFLKVSLSQLVLHQVIVLRQMLMDLCGM